MSSVMGWDCPEADTKPLDVSIQLYRLQKYTASPICLSLDALAR